MSAETAEHGITLVVNINYQLFRIHRGRAGIQPFVCHSSELVVQTVLYSLIRVHDIQSSSQNIYKDT